MTKQGARARGQGTDDPELNIKIGDKSYAVRIGELTGRDVRDYRALLGFPPQRVFSDPKEFDLDAMAGLVWLVRRRDEPNLGFEKVLDAINYGNLDIANDDETEGKDEEASPEA